MLPHDGINSADFNCQRTLTCRRTHDLRRQYLTNQMLFSQSNQARRGKNDGGVFAGFEFAKPKYQRFPAKDESLGPDAGLLVGPDGVGCWFRRVRRAARQPDSQSCCRTRPADSHAW